jgi:hypothetical protein
MRTIHPVRSLIYSINRQRRFPGRLMCQASAQASDRFCVLNVGAIEVAVTDSQGKPVTDSQAKPAKRVFVV